MKLVMKTLRQLLMMISHRSDAEKVYLIKEGKKNKKKKVINEVIKRDEVINNSLK